jgi:endonuclease YncB( thermonuclease family)
MARTAFRAWLRGRAAACDVPSRPTGITTHCTLDGEDMALWLVRNGWAESAGGQYGDAETKAKREKRGMFGPSPIETSPQ